MLRSFVQHNGVLLLATLLVTPISLVFSIITARMLGPTQYGAVGVLLALYQILAQAVGPFSLVTSKYVADYHALGDQSSLAAALRNVVFLLMIVSMGSMLVIGSLSPLIQSFLRLESSSTVILAGGLFVLSLGVEMVRGLLQGLHSFGRLALNQIAEALARLACGIGLLWAGLAVNGVIAAYMLGALVAIALVSPQLWRILYLQRSHLPLRPILVYARAVVVMGICNAIYANADLILVKHYFSPFDAGIYAAVASFGRILYIGTSVLFTTMFPIIAGLNALKKSGVRVLALNMSVLIISASVAVIIFAVKGKWLLQNIYGADYVAGAGLLAWYGLSILIALPVGAINVYLLAQARARLLVVLALGACLQVGLIMLMHRTLFDVIVMVSISNMVLLIAYALLMGRSFFTRSRTLPLP